MVSDKEKVCKTEPVFSLTYISCIEKQDEENVYGEIKSGKKIDFCVMKKFDKVLKH